MEVGRDKRSRWIPWEALARSCSVGVMGGLTIGWVMMRCTLVAMVAEFHVV